MVLTMPKKNRYNFDELITREGTDAIKWDTKFMEEYFGVGDLLPLWVADMDFRAPEVLLQALKKRVDHGIFGYTIPSESYYQAIINWFKRRHGWSIEKEWLQFAPGVVTAINVIIQTFSKPGDGVIIQEPVYYPFARTIKNNGREVLNNELLFSGGSYQIDFNDLKEKCAMPRTKLLILCSPHNPIARVWKTEELKQLGEICIENNVLVISDEIHCDITFNNHKHIPFASISRDFAERSFTCVAPTKTFNIAGLKSSNVIIPNPTLREDFTTVLTNISIASPSIFALVATETAYNSCENWLNEVLAYIWDNYCFLKDFFAINFPNCYVLPLEGTYLPWVDFRPLGIEAKELDRIIKEEAKVGLDDGAMFGESGAGFQRINIACPREILKEALNRIRDALIKHLKK